MSTRILTITAVEIDDEGTLVDSDHFVMEVESTEHDENFGYGMYFGKVDGEPTKLEIRQGDKVTP